MISSVSAADVKFRVLPMKIMENIESRSRATTAISKSYGHHQKLKTKYRTQVAKKQNMNFIKKVIGDKIDESL